MPRKLALLWMLFSSVTLTEPSGAQVMFEDRNLAAPLRSLSLTGAPNFRDVGGYATADGRHVRWRSVYRSNELSKLTADDAARVAGLQLVAVVDLRTQDERKHAPTVWLKRPPGYYESEQASLAPVMHDILSNAQTDQGARSGILNYYKRLPGLYRAEYAVMFHQLAAAQVPMLVHCTAGKDRTGLAIALLLSVLGVPKETVEKDYALTEQFLSTAPGQTKEGPVGGAAGATLALAQLPESSRRILWRADPIYIDASMNAIDEEYGNLDGYLERGLGLSIREIEAVRKALLH